MTNGDKIRSMDDIELADFLDKAIYHCRGCPLNLRCDGTIPCNEQLQGWLEETWTDS